MTLPAAIIIMAGTLSIKVTPPAVCGGIAARGGSLGHFPAAMQCGSSKLSALLNLRLRGGGGGDEGDGGDRGGTTIKGGGVWEGLVERCLEGRARVQGQDLSGDGGVVAELVGGDRGKLGEADGWGRCPPEDVHVYVHYVGMVRDELGIIRVFNDSRATATPAHFVIDDVGAGSELGMQGVPAWILAAKAMHRGDIMRIDVAPRYAFGANGSADGLVAPNATLTYLIELVRFGEMDVRSDGSVMVTYLRRGESCLDGSGGGGSKRGSKNAKRAGSGYNTAFSGGRGVSAEFLLSFQARCGGEVYWESKEEPVAFWVTAGGWWRGDWVSAFRRKEFRGKGDDILGTPVKRDRKEVAGWEARQEQDGGVLEEGAVEASGVLFGGSSKGGGGREADERLPLGIIEACRSEFERGCVCRVVMQPNMAHMLPRMAAGSGGEVLLPQGKEIVWEVHVIGWHTIIDVLETDNRPGAVLVKQMMVEDAKFAAEIEDGSWARLTITGVLTHADQHSMAPAEEGDVTIMPKCQWEGVVGDGDLPDGVELGLVTLRQAQSAIVHITDPKLAASFKHPDGMGAVPRMESGEFPAVQYHVVVESFKPCHEMESSDRINSAQRRKLHGNWMHDQGQWALAVAKYEHAEALICLETEGDDIHSLKFDLALNKAACFLRLREFPEALSECNDAIQLQPSSAKAYHRRGKAYMGLGQEDRAQLDFKKAIEFRQGSHGPSHSTAAELNGIKQIQEEQGRKSKVVYGKMFGSAGLHAAEGKIGHAVVEKVETFKADSNNCMAGSSGGVKRSQDAEEVIRAVQRHQLSQMMGPSSDKHMMEKVFAEHMARGEEGIREQTERWEEGSDDEDEDQDQDEEYKKKEKEDGNLARGVDRISVIETKQELPSGMKKGFLPKTVPPEGGSGARKDVPVPTFEARDADERKGIAKKTGWEFGADSVLRGSRFWDSWVKEGKVKP